MLFYLDFFFKSLQAVVEKDETIEKLKKDLEKVVFAVTLTDVYVVTSFGEVCCLFQMHVVPLALRAQMMDQRSYSIVYDFHGFI